MTDPVLGDRIGPLRRRAAVTIDAGFPDAVLISHLHHDHLDLGSLRLIPRGAVLVAPNGAGSLLRSLGFLRVWELDSRQRARVGSVDIEAVPARHVGRRLPFGPSAPALGYLIDGDHQIYFAGDTDIFPEMALLSGSLDLAILPVGGWGPTLRGGHMDPARAALALTLLRPRHALAVHWGTLWPIGLGRLRRARFEEPARRFVEAAHRAAPEVSVALLDPGESLELSPHGALLTSS
jgi:L-ascorbate metabolism protein UlaG (beta-lactamase superfamily)